GIVDVARPRDHLVDRADADDLPRRLRDALHDPTALELAHRLASAEELAGEVDADDGVPLLEREVLEGSVALQAGVADQDVDGAKGPAGSLGALIHCRRALAL